MFPQTHVGRTWRESKISLILAGADIAHIFGWELSFRYLQLYLPIVQEAVQEVQKVPSYFFPPQLDC